MTDAALTQALENIYTSLNNNNQDIDVYITQLKAAGYKDIVVDPGRLAHNNRQGRKLMQSYFRKKGVNVSFS